MHVVVAVELVIIWNSVHIKKDISDDDLKINDNLFEKHF